MRHTTTKSCSQVFNVNLYRRLRGSGIPPQSLLLNRRRKSCMHVFSQPTATLLVRGPVPTIAKTSAIDGTWVGYVGSTCCNSVGEMWRRTWLTAELRKNVSEEFLRFFRLVQQCVLVSGPTHGAKCCSACAEKCLARTIYRLQTNCQHSFRTQTQILYLDFLISFLGAGQPGEQHRFRTKQRLLSLSQLTWFWIKVRL